MKIHFKSFFLAAAAGAVLTAGAQTTFPLRVDIDVNPKTTKKNIGAGTSGEAKMQQVQVHVKIRQSGGQLYEAPLKAELYVIGKQIHTGYYGIIDVIKKDFTFSQENSRTFEFSSQMYSIGQTSGNINVGGTYETYLVVVVDDKGEIVDTRSGRVIREQGIAFIRELGPMTLFDRDGNVIGKVENPGEAFRRAVPAATYQGTD
jgi:hypothetical protein